MADTGWRIAGTGANVAAEGGGQTWANPGNITNATLSSAIAVEATGATQNLRATNFGFAIPAGMSIAGVEARISRRAPQGGDVRDFNLRLVVANSLTGANRASADKWPASFGDAEYGSPSDLWSVSLTPEQVNASTFGVQLRANAVVKDDPGVQAIWMRVHYEEPEKTYIAHNGLLIPAKPHVADGGLLKPAKRHVYNGGWRS